ncbi:MAG: tRNA pseudouridine(55) synthase TruB [Elusimicrobia bacterium]|nr:tRNA pseudouridine(55) synthase TruB [Elusimicrobiota bacterium]
MVAKPQGITSAGVVRVVKRILGDVKVGHCGTLDPMATGVLLVVFGRATKRQAELMAHEKVYEGAFRLGITTDTWDVTGQVALQRAVPALSISRVQEICNQLTGWVPQIPPMYSARRIGGRRLYALARQGREIPRATRPVHIQEFSLLAWNPPRGTFRVRCSSGTYIRSLVHEVGERLLTGATLEVLHRISVGPFTIAQALPWEALQRATQEALLRCAVLERLP